MILNEFHQLCNSPVGIKFDVKGSSAMLMPNHTDTTLQIAMHSTVGYRQISGGDDHNFNTCTEQKCKISYYLSGVQ